ncbi:MAG: hypothetical protein MZV64_52310 [Ignavibacteriales bacterium]|nr:hypothetical protein [Ignavibacteriales bacterium]
MALNEKYLKHAMHGAAVLTLLGFAGTVSGLIKFFKMLGGAEMEPDLPQLQCKQLWLFYVWCF